MFQHRFNNVNSGFQHRFTKFQIRHKTAKSTSYQSGIEHSILELQHVKKEMIR